ncbi:hypothetical protein NWP22_06190 [Anabaenopsis tanganyikae CS-531]|uniref:Procyclic acidic repetitive family protein n=2 Tax=Anabaenopsis TaxID=110103 RepID=A0ABT5AR37_9CYAN|nr:MULTISPECIES: procyclic acidic repetitive family protein [Anabaenopsis]MDB9539741.1 procyclic acidic repetitive family protein [Anabaenopsis arnoldii]MDH6092046.1 hypothetical protein [Anabaenopsis arnoldii]MDH6105459.1 hypothetical protein [Anabaenopsis tanganyikae CS-531]
MSQDNQNSQPSPSPQVPLWKVKIIQIIRGTIGILETAVVKLETPVLPGSEETPRFWQGLVIQWNRFLRQVRLFLPSNVSNNLSDAVLSGILAMITVAVMWSTVSIFMQNQTEVATVAPVAEVPAPIPEPIPTPEVPAPIPEAIPTPEVIPEPQAIPTPEVIPEPEAIPTPEVIPEPQPIPILKLTPEETLIAAIKNQVAEISDRFASGLIQSIQANFRTSNLTVKINDDWYNLPESEQKQLAGEILQRSQELDFTHLEIIDSQDKLIARNPVVGNEIIIFQ